LRLTAGFTAKVDVALAVGGVAETPTVSGAAPVVDVKATAARTQLTRETLEVLPTSRSGLIAVMAQAPAWSPTWTSAATRRGATRASAPSDNPASRGPRSKGSPRPPSGPLSTAAETSST